MQIKEQLDENLTQQLFELYKSIWFTQGRAIDDIRLMLENSYLTLAFVRNRKLIGFCRVISDGVYKAFLFDVIVDPSFQNSGTGSLIIETVLEHKKIKGIRHVELYCPDKITALLGVQIALVQSTLFNNIPSFAIRSIFGVGAISANRDPYALIAFEA